MASGQIISAAAAWTPTQTSPARGTSIANGSTPVGYHDVFAFSGTTAEYLDFTGVFEPLYTGVIGIKFRALVVANTTANASVWQLGIRRLNTSGTAEILNAAHSFTMVAGAAISWATAAYNLFPLEIVIPTASTDGVLAGEGFVGRLLRDPAHASDTYTGDGYVVWPTAHILES